MAYWAQVYLGNFGEDEGKGNSEDEGEREKSFPGHTIRVIVNLVVKDCGSLHVSLCSVTALTG